ncbi:POK9 protein, partial [Dyaphorophyia castanea]|nr:POK9 protein [Platysteira castanea]
QLRATVSQFGVTSEPVRQMLDYIWSTQVLLPADCTNSRCLSASTKLQPATGGSLGMDLAAAVDTTLMTTRPHKIPTGVTGPLVLNDRCVGALLLGRSSSSLMGLFVLPGVIDADYNGEIMIMAHTPFPPIKVTKGQRIAQLVPLEQLTKNVAPLTTQPRDKKGFGSTGGLTLLTINLHERPRKQVVLEYGQSHCTLEGLLDTGADSTIVSPHCGPPQWPLQPATATVSGVGGLTLASQS